MLKISIITVCYNSQAFIKTAIESVIHQTYPNIEYIIVDGGSKDNTISIINNYKDKIAKFISEPDNGIYDAMNKGMKLATGDIIGIINSDDVLFDNTVIDNIAKTFENNKVDCIFGDLIYVSNNDLNKQIRYWKSSPYKPNAFKKGWHPAHPTFYVKRNIYEKFGYFNLNFKLAADFELMLRFLEKNKITSYYIPKPLVKMRLGGTTNKNLKNIIKQNIECYKAFKTNDLKVSIFYPLLRLIPKISQFFK